MKKFILITTLFSLLSCKENRSNTNDSKTTENIVENAESSSYTRFSKGGNLIDAIYYEQTKKEENLKKIDEKIAKLAIAHNSQKENEVIFSKSNEYYNDAYSIANSIKDSILKKEILEIIKKSDKKNDIKEKPAKELHTTIRLNNIKIQENYNVFKIRKTLPEIEKYQNANPLKTDSLNNYIKKQNQLLTELKNLK